MNLTAVDGGFGEGDVATLVCPLCNKPVHITEFGPDGDPLPDAMRASISEYVIAHWEVFHPHRTRLLRWISNGWFPS